MPRIKTNYVRIQPCFLSYNACNRRVRLLKLPEAHACNYQFQAIRASSVYRILRKTQIEAFRLDLAALFRPGTNVKTCEGNCSTDNFKII